MVDEKELAKLAVLVAGSQAALAKAIGVSIGAVNAWQSSGVSPKHYLTVYDYVKDAGRLGLLTGGDK